MTYFETHLTDWDPLDPALSADLWNNLGEAQQKCPVLRSSAVGGFTALTRWDDVDAAARDWKRLCSGHGIGAVTPENDHRFILLESDPPYHHQLRTLLNPYFTQQATARYEERTRELAVELIEEISPRGRCELMEDFAVPFPGRVVYEGVLGAPRDELGRVIGWLISIVTDPIHSGQARQELTAWAEDLLDARREQPRRHDMIDGLLHGQIAGRSLTIDEQANLLGLMVLGATDNTTNTIGNIGVHLATNPNLTDRLHRNPDLIEHAVEEFLRFEASVPALSRVSTEEFELGGETIAAGERVLLYFGAANRDPTHFKNPDVLDIDRDEGGHLSFGTGIHRCIGRHLARLEIRVAIEELVRRWTDIGLAAGSDVQYRTGLSHGPLSVPLVFTPR